MQIRLLLKGLIEWSGSGVEWLGDDQRRSGAKASLRWEDSERGGCGGEVEAPASAAGRQRPSAGSPLHS